MVLYFSSNNYFLKDVKDLIADAVRILKQNNYKLTKQRRSLLEYLSDNQHEYLEVTQVDKHMREIYPTMSYNTVYRNLREFEQIGIIETKSQAGATNVKYQCDFSNMHHHHFICRNCGAVFELDECPLDYFQEQLPGCKIEGHRFEIYGICDKCLAHGVAEN